MGLFADKLSEPVDLDYESDGEDKANPDDDTDMSPGALALKAIKEDNGAAFEEAIRKIK